MVNSCMDGVVCVLAAVVLDLGYVRGDRSPLNERWCWNTCIKWHNSCPKSLTLHLVGKDDNDDAHTKTGLLHLTNILKHIVLPSFDSNRIVCSDPYNALVWATKKLYRNNLKFVLYGP